jgi:hypothetical protein
VAPRTPASPVRLAAGALTLELPSALVARARPLGPLEGFLSEHAQAPSAPLRVAWEPLPDGAGLEQLSFQAEGPVLCARGPSSPEGALAVLRGAWAEACGRQGGVLLHGAGILHRGRALVVTGPPDAGKSTAAELALQAGATLLSDEVLALFPDGTVQGTPFRSSLTWPPSPARARCAAVLGLEKASAESIRDAPPAAFAAALLSQVWTPAGLGLPATEGRAVALRFADQGFRGTFAFRKHPDAGRFLLEWLDAL